MAWVAVSLAAIALAIAAWGWFEAGWLRRRELAVPIEGLTPELDGLRIAHLSDFHLGMPSRGRRAAEDAVEWVERRRPDLVCVTGDLLSRRSGAGRLRALADRLAKVAPCYVVLGNHDFGITRDPGSRDPKALDLGSARLLADESAVVTTRGRAVRLVGVDPRTYRARTTRPERLARPDDDLRILLCHYPGVAPRLPDGAFHLVLAGHLHAGQIVLPYPGGKLRLAHPSWREVEGLYRHPGGMLHISPGIGTTFVPFRFFARPEVTELVVRSS